MLLRQRPASSRVRSQAAITASMAARCAADGTEKDDGAYLKVKCAAQCADVQGHNAVVLRARFRPVGGAWNGYTALLPGAEQLLGGGLEVEEEQPSELNEIAQQLAVLNDQLVQQAVRRRKVIRYAFVGVFAAIFVLIGAAIGLRVYTESQLRDEASLRTVRYECTLDGESYVYEASYNSQYQILYEGGDAWISNHVRPEQYEDVNVLSAQMQDYFEEKGGTCTIIDKNP